MTLGMVRSGLSDGGGSGLVTSRPAPAKRLERRASIKSPITTKSPREVFTKSEPCFMLWNAFWFIISRVESILGQ